MNVVKDDVVALAHVVADHLDFLVGRGDYRRDWVAPLSGRLRRLALTTPVTEIVNSYQAVCASSMFPPEAQFFLMQKAIHDCFVIDELEDLELEDEGEDDDATEHRRVVVEGGVYARHGEEEMAQLWLENVDEYDRRRVTGYSYFFEMPSGSDPVGYRWMDIVPDRAKVKPRRKTTDRTTDPGDEGL